MDITIQQARSPALERDGRYYQVFTPQSPDEVIQLHHMGCAGDTMVRQLQIEEGTKPTAFVEPQSWVSPLSGLLKDMRDLRVELTDKDSPFWGAIQANNRGMLSEFYKDTVQTAIAQSGSQILATVEEKTQDNVKRTELNLDNNGFVTKVGKTVDGRLLATMIAQNERDVSIIAQKLKVTADMLVDGAITARSLDVNSVRSGILTAGSISSDMIQTRAITGDKILFNQAFFNRFMAEEGYLKQLFAKDVFATSVQAVDLSATRVKSGLLQARNGAMAISLDEALMSFYQNATIEFHSANNALVRRKGTHTAFVHFADVSASSDQGAGSLYASIGVTSSGDGINSSSSGRFAGLRVFRAAQGLNHTAIIDQTEIYGDDVLIKDDFSLNRGFRFRPDRMASMVNMNYLVDTVRALARCWLHVRNVGWNTSDPILGRAIIDEYNAHMKDL